MEHPSQKLTLIHILIIVHGSFCFFIKLVSALEIKAMSFFYSLTMFVIVLELSSIGGRIIFIEAIAIGPTILNLALVEVSIGVDESAETMGNSILKGAFIIASIGIVIFANALWGVVLPLPFVHDASFMEFIYLGFVNSPFNFVLFDGESSHLHQSVLHQF